MKIENFDFGFPLILIDNYYSSDESKLIWDELDFLYDNNFLHLGSDSRSGSAVSKSGIPLKNNYSVFLDGFYSHRNMSNILTVNRKLLNYWDNVVLQNNHWFYKNFECIEDFTMVSYYENQNNYEIHKDKAVITSLTWLYREPKKFTGGNFYFENDNRIEVLNNRTVIFPSMMSHGVETVKMDKKYNNKKLGRFCITQFLHSS